MIKEEPIEVIIIPDSEPELYSSDEYFQSAAPQDSNYHNNYHNRSDHPSLDNQSKKQKTGQNGADDESRSCYNVRGSSGSSSGYQRDESNSNSQSTSQSNIPTNTQTNTQTVFRSYSIGSVPKFGEDGQVLTLGQRLALTRKRLEEGVSSSPNLPIVPSSRAEPTSSTSSQVETSGGDASSTRNQTLHNSASQKNMDIFSEVKYNVALKVLVPEPVRRAMLDRGRELYEKDGCKIRITRFLFPEYNECQIYLKGPPKQVLDCLYAIWDDLRQHSGRWRNSIVSNRDETMLLVTDIRFIPELLRYQKGKRMVQHIEQNNGVWIRVEDRIAERECVISVTGHSEQMRNGLRQLMGELVYSPFAETLPPLFHFLPSPHPGYHGYYPGNRSYLPSIPPDRTWLSCDRREYWGSDFR